MNRFSAALAALLLVASPLALANPINVQGTFGGRSLDDGEFWGELEDQAKIGVMADFAFTDTLPLYATLSLDVSAAQEDDANYELTGAVRDLSAGIKLMPLSGTWRPYGAVGLASVHGGIEYDSDYYSDSDDTDGDVGMFVAGGLLVRVGKGLNLGAEMRAVRGTDVVLYGADTTLDYNQFSLFVGWGWD